jgi:uncharacterized protein with PIN domain
MVDTSALVAIAMSEPHATRLLKKLHAAALNYGDCFSYALATVTNEPLLCVGDDFVRTDVAVATASPSARTCRRA